MANYHFKTIWKLRAPIEKVYAAIYDAEEYPQWWKGQLKVERLSDGFSNGVGTTIRFTTRSQLPYRLTFTTQATRIEPLKRIDGKASGELEGTGTWLFKYEEGVTTVTYIWKVRTTTFFMNFLAPVLRPVYVWNHDVIMRWGGEGLARKLQAELL
ncbi:MAG: SRPBCC family protein [Chitinophagales bacterium]